MGNEERAAKAEALLRYEELKQKRVLLMSEAEKFAKQYEAAAKLLRERPETMSPDPEYLKSDVEKLVALINDLKAIRSELQDAYMLVQKLGFRPTE